MLRALGPMAQEELINVENPIVLISRPCSNIIYLSRVQSERVGVDGRPPLALCHSVTPSPRVVGFGGGRERSTHGDKSYRG